MNPGPLLPRRRHYARGLVSSRIRAEQLESRRLMAVTVTGSVTLDESPGLQTGGVAVTGEDNNDSDVTLATLQSQAASLNTRLFGAGGLGFSSTFAGAISVAKSSDTFIQVTGGGTVASLGFTKSDGTALPVLGGADPGVSSGLSVVSGGAVTLFADNALGNRLVIGVDGSGDKVLALFLDPTNASLTSARVWLVQNEALANPVTTDPDDPLTLAGLGVSAGKSIEFNFNNLPSGQNLFGTVGDTSHGLVVIGQTPVLSPDGTFTNASNTINTSQGGGPTTIGVDNQMFDPNDGAYFTFVKNPVPNFLAGAPGGLDQGEADDADNIQYTGGTIEGTSSFVKIAQIQGNALATMDIKCFDMAGSPQGQSYVNTGLGTGTVRTITAVRVFNAAGTKIEDSALPGNQDPNVVITFPGGGVARVAGLNANFRVEFDTTGVHDQVLIRGVVGKFDIGGFGTNEAASELAPLSGIRYEDSGPVIGPIDNSILDFAGGQTITKTLNGVVGTDPKSAPYTVDQFTAGLTINGVAVNGVLSANKQVVTYFADTGGNGTFGDAGDTPYFRLTLNQSGAGSYTFDVLFTPPAANLEFNFDELPSGQNLFGIVGDTSNALIVIGQNPVLAADGTFTNASNTINTSQGGGPTTIGVNNQMFDPGDGALFTFIQDPDPNFLAGAPGGLDQGEADDADNILYTGGTLEVDTAFVKISQLQGNALATMDVKCFDITGAPQGRNLITVAKSAVPITDVRVFNAAGTKVEDTSLPGNQDPNVVITIGTGANGVPLGVARVAGLNAKFRVDWDTSAPHDQALIAGVAGKFDVGGFGTSQDNPTPDQKLDFVAKITDGDGDSATASFSVGVDGTGVFDDGIVSGVVVSSTLASSANLIESPDGLAALLD